MNIKHEEQRPSEEIRAENHPIIENEDYIELGDNFNFDGFQVVRREFFAHLREPSISFNNCKFSINTACLSKFPNTEYVQVMVNKDNKTLALRPCEEGARDSFLWCLNSGGKRKPRAITGKIFFAKIVSLMNWNPDYRYKLLGRLVHATEVYQRTFKEGEKPKTSRTPVFPESWKEQFGIPFNEHQQSMQINIFDGYAIYAIKDNSANSSNKNQITDAESLPSRPISTAESLILGENTQ